MTSTPTGPSPNFYGLFVGINPYESDDIDNVASAVRDGTALHALFEDNLGRQYDSSHGRTSDDRVASRCHRRLAAPSVRR